MDIVKLIGADLLAEEQKLVLETAKAIRVGFLQQNAMHETDCYVPINKQYLMMKLIFELHDRARVLVAKQIPNDQPEKFDELRQKLSSLLSEIEKKYDM